MTIRRVEIERLTVDNLPNVRGVVAALKRRWQPDMVSFVKETRGARTFSRVCDLTDMCLTPGTQFSTNDFNWTAPDPLLGNEIEVSLIPSIAFGSNRIGSRDPYGRYAQFRQLPGLEDAW